MSYLFHSVKRRASSLKKRTIAQVLAFQKAWYRLRHRLGNRSSDFIGFDKYSIIGAYHWQEIKANPYYKQKADFLTESCSNSAVIADFGCGDGAIIGLLAANFVGKKFIGIEADSKACKLAYQMLEANRIANATIIKSPFGSLRLDLGPVDLAYSMDVIEHLPDPDIMLKKMASLVRPCGTIIIGTPLYISDELVSPYHVHEFELKELESLIDKYFDVTTTRLLPEKRRDGKVYSENFCIITASRRPC